MSDVSDFQIVIDTQAILSANEELSLDWAVPTSVEDEHCYLIAAPAHVRHGQATGRMRVGGIYDQELCFRSLSLSGNSGQAATIYNIRRQHEIFGEGPVSPEEAIPYVPVPILVEARNTEPPTFAATPVGEYFMMARPLHEGLHRFEIEFYITVQNIDGGGVETAGYFSWCAALIVEPD